MSEVGITFPIWVVYDHPCDAPDVYVARQWLVSANGTVLTAETLTYATHKKLRDEFMRMNLTRLPRSRHDEPVILETWL